MSGAEVVGIFGGLAATGLATYVGLVVKPLERELEATEKQRKLDREADAKQRAEDKALYDARINALHADKKDLERRLTEVEKNALTRSEMDAVRRDMANTIEKVGDRMVQAMSTLTARVDHALERVAQVEAARGT
jgi:hypothetical protein